jgi:hypothetical protein
VGIAASSALLSWRLATLTGSGQNTLGVSRDHLLAAGRDVILLLVAFAIVAGAVSLLRSSPKPLAPAHVSA